MAGGKGQRRAGGGRDRGPSAPPDPPVKEAEAEQDGGAADEKKKELDKVEAWRKAQSEAREKFEKWHAEHDVMDDMVIFANVFQEAAESDY